MDNYQYQNVRAHDFSTTDESYLVTLVEEIKAETQLVSTDFLSNNNISASAHANNAAELLKNLQYNIMQTSPPSSDIAQIYDQGEKNSTTLALVVANIVDDILRKYGSAFAVGYDMTNMSNMMNMDMMMTMMTNNATNGSGNALSRDSNISMNTENNLALVNINDYETAKVLSSNIKDQFINQLRPRSLVNETTNLDKLENSLGKLEQAVNTKALPEAMMDLVHIQIHPMLQRVYDLELRQNVGTTTSD
ncbi:MAG: hypothetical protein GEU26_11990 [Nitrososphaeraceae archaeon]|nr:hypothetical protein [Nitrososphaeraceae archaeon]